MGKKNREIGWECTLYSFLSSCIFLVFQGNIQTVILNISISVFSYRLYMDLPILSDPKDEIKSKLFSLIHNSANFSVISV
jgi:hypothetical protein